MISNPLAPSAYEGIPAEHEDYMTRIYTPIFNSGDLQAGSYQNLYVQLDGDADFILCGLQCPYVVNAPGDFGNWKIQIFDNDGVSLTNGYIYAASFGIGMINPVPFPIIPGRPLRAGSLVSFSVVNFGTSDIFIQIAMRGFKRWSK